MAKLVRLRVVEDVAIVSLAAEPVNALTSRVRGALWQALDRIEANSDVKAAIIVSKMRVFATGVDVQDIDDTKIAPTLGQLCARIEDCPKPVIAAAAGQALDAGADLLLAAHYRLAASKVRIGFGSVALGLIPPGGGTQRLPRLIGATAALDLMVSGQPIDAVRAKFLGLIDGLVDEDFGARVFAVAKALIKKGATVRPTRDMRGQFRDGRAYQQAIATARANLVGPQDHAAHRIIDCIEAAAILPFDTGLAFEDDTLARCLAHPQSVALRHLTRAERRIDSALMERVDGALKPVVPMGEAAVQRLRDAMARAGEVLISQGVTAAQIDGAMTAYGFPDGPFKTGAAPKQDTQIADRIVAAILVEGAACVAQGAVQRPSDIDVLAVHGLGFPRDVGGPFRAAQTNGLITLRKQLRIWVQDSAVWAVPEMVEDALKDARGFDAPIFDSSIKS